MFRKCDVFNCERDAYKRIKVAHNEYALCPYHQPTAWEMSHEYCDELIQIMRKWDKAILNLPLKDKS